MIPPEIKSFAKSFQQIPRYARQDEIRHEFIGLVNRHCGLHCHESQFLNEHISRQVVNRLIAALRRGTSTFCQSIVAADASAYEVFSTWIRLIDLDELYLIVGLAHRLGVLKLDRESISSDMDWRLLHACVVEDLIISSLDARIWCAAEFDYYGLSGHYESEGVLTLRYQM